MGSHLRGPDILWQLHLRCDYGIHHSIAAKLCQHLPARHPSAAADFAVAALGLQLDIKVALRPLTLAVGPLFQQHA